MQHILDSLVKLLPVEGGPETGMCSTKLQKFNGKQVDHEVSKSSQYIHSKPLFDGVEARYVLLDTGNAAGGRQVHYS